MTRKCVDKPPRKLINTVPAIHFDVDTIDVRLRAFWGRRPVVESSQTENSWERGPRVHRLQRIDHDSAVVRVGQMGLMRSV
jgi:hypothetical protein